MIPKYIATLGLRDYMLVTKFQDVFPFVSRCGLFGVGNYGHPTNSFLIFYVSPENECKYIADAPLPANFVQDYPPCYND